MRRIQLTVCGQREISQLRAGRLRSLLPRDEVGVVLHLVEQDFIPGLEELATPGLSDQIDRHRRAGCEDDLRRVLGVDEPSDFFASRFQFNGHAVAELMDAAMHVRVAGLVDFANLVDDRLRLLRGGSVVEVRERGSVR